MRVYLRHIHKISKNPKEDTTGPFEIPETADIRAIWSSIRRHCGGRLSGVVPARAERGGFVFFFARSSCFHSVLVCPIGSDLYREYIGE